MGEVAIVCYVLLALYNEVVVWIRVSGSGFRGSGFGFRIGLRIVHRLVVVCVLWLYFPRDACGKETSPLKGGGMQVFIWPKVRLAAISERDLYHLMIVAAKYYTRAIWV